MNKSQVAVSAFDKRAQDYQEKFMDMDLYHTMEGEYSKSGLRSSSKGNQVFIYYHQADYLTKAMEEKSLVRTF